MGADLPLEQAIYALQLDGQGGSRALTDQLQASLAQPAWLHLDYREAPIRDWLATTPLLPDPLRQSLSGESLRPRLTRQGRGSCSPCAASIPIRRLIRTRIRGWCCACM